MTSAGVQFGETDSTAARVIDESTMVEFCSFGRLHYRLSAEFGCWYESVVMVGNAGDFLQEIRAWIGGDVLDRESRWAGW